MSATDLLRAVRMVGAIGGLDHDVVAAVMDGAPYSKSRPRFSRNGNTYVKKEDRISEEQTKIWMRANIPANYTGNVALTCIFFRPNRQRIDVDNMLKHICDAATGVIWKDDSQCTALLGVAEFDASHPRTVLAIAAHVSTLPRGTDDNYPCAVCGTPIVASRHSSRPKTCSKPCAVRSRGYVPLEVLIPCAECGTPFRRTTGTQKLCSPDCRAERLRGSNRRRSSPRSKCADCGAQLAHHRGGRCRSCWRAQVGVA